MTENKTEIGELRNKVYWINQKIFYMWVLLVLFLVLILIHSSEIGKVKSELSSVPHKVCENETNTERFCNNCIYQWSKGYNYSKNKNYPEYPEMMAPKVCRESGDIIYEDYVDNSNLSKCYNLDTNEIVYCNQPVEVRSCIHKGVATIYLVNGWTNPNLNVGNAFTYLRNNQTNEIYKVREDGFVDLGYVKGYETLVLVNVSQEVVNILDKLEEVCHYE